MTSDIPVREICYGWEGTVWPWQDVVIEHYERRKTNSVVLCFVVLFSSEQFNKSVIQSNMAKLRFSVDNVGSLKQLQKSNYYIAVVIYL